jgi:predicted ATPase/DNA-binding XRE family transcriptional regulator
LLRRARHAAGLTQEELAERAELTDRGIRYLEHGVRRPNRETVLRLGHALGLSADELPRFVAAARSRRLSTRPGELRVPPHPLVGRERDVMDLRDRLIARDVRLLTLTGPGGVGKTSLALFAASAARPAFPGGVTWVPLAALADATLVPTAVAHAFGLMDIGNSAAAEAVGAALDGRPRLVVLDNLEHLAAAGFISDLIGSCPQLTLLATSRSPVGIRAEQEFAVLPLAIPTQGSGLAVQALAANPSVDLFLRRAQAVQPGFVLTETNAEAVAMICRLLDGLPLAIELAAARIRVLPPQVMLLHLDDRLGFLTGGPSDLPLRQRAMRATVAWSYDLLMDSHQEAFAQLAVFDGSFGFAALEAVLCTDALAILEAVEALHRSSLLQLDDSVDEDPRFRMLGTIRDFALERLAGREDADELRGRHAYCYLSLAEKAGPESFGPDATHWLDRLEEDKANLRGALGWYLSRREVTRGLRLCAALWPFWYVRGYATEGRSQLAAFLALLVPAADDTVRPHAEALLGMGQLAQTQGDFAVAASSLAKCIQLYRSLGDERSMAAALLAAGFTARVTEDYDAARDLLEQALRLSRKHNHSFIVAAALHHLGMIATDADDDPSAAQHLLDQSLTLYETLGLPRFVALVHLTMGEVAGQQQDYQRSHSLLTEGLAGLTQAGERLGIHGALDALARVAADEGRWTRTVTLAAAAERLRRTTGSRSWPVVERRRGRWLGQAQDAMTVQEFHSAWSRGEAFSPEEAIGFALE